MANVFRLSPLGRDILRRYAGAGMSARLFLNLRWRWTPYEHIASCVPSHGTILDLGSGHGLLALAMGLSGPGRTIHGIDHEAARVEMAQKAAVGLGNLSFATGGLMDAVADEKQHGSIAGIVIMDAIHYLSFAEQEAFLAHARKALQPGGVLLIRDVDASAGKNFFINRMHEKVMTGLGFTRADGLNFRTHQAWLDLLARFDFDSTSEPCSRFPFADRLFVCRPRSAVVTRAA